MPDLGIIANTSIPQDALSRTTQAIREALHGRTQKRDLLGRIPMPKYEELRKRELEQLKGIGSTSSALTPNADWSKGGPTPPEINSPTQRIDREVYLYDLVVGEFIKFQFIPSELEYTPNSNFETIASMGRNNPLYHYTGSEDILKFNLDWYAEEESREDVIRKCKRLESLTKNDGFDNPPHHVKLIWNSLIYSDATWIVTSAPYKLSLFQAHRNMLPQQAYQELTLKRVTVNNALLDNINQLNW